jgi:hypothetical protein
LKKALGYGTEHVFHTMRGTLIQLMRDAGANSDDISAVAGHATGNFSLDNYTKGAAYARQLEAISKVSSPHERCGVEFPQYRVCEGGRPGAAAGEVGYHQHIR